VGAGLADPEGVRAEPLVFVAEPTESRDGLDGVTVVTRRVGMRDVPSSVGFTKKVRIEIFFSKSLKLTVAVQRQVGSVPGATSAQRSGIWFGVASRATRRYSGSETKEQRITLNPLSIKKDHFHTHLTPTDDFLGVNPRPMLLSLSLNESGVEADNEDRDGRDMAMDRDERSRT
jgi:hypothetical protein